MLHIETNSSNTTIVSQWKCLTSKRFAAASTQYKILSVKYLDLYTIWKESYVKSINLKAPLRIVTAT